MEIKNEKQIILKTTLSKTSEACKSNKLLSNTSKSTNLLLLKIFHLISLNLNLPTNKTVTEDKSINITDNIDLTKLLQQIDELLLNELC